MSPQPTHEPSPIDLMRQAIDILDRKPSTASNTPLAQLGKYLPPGIRLRTGGDAKRGGAHYYLTLPLHWAKPGYGHWLGGNNRSGYWMTGWAPTEKAAILKGLGELMMVLFEAELARWDDYYDLFDEKILPTTPEQPRRQTTMKCLRIDPDGFVTTSDEPALDLARSEFEATSVVTLVAPFLPSDEIWVGVIDDFGAQDQPINPKAWGLYGRSPIYGSMFVGLDSRGDIPPVVAAVIGSDLTDWPITRSIYEVLTSQPARPAMLAERPDGEQAT